MNRASGFTLLELLVAIAVFAIMSVMAYGGLRVVLETRQDVAGQADALAGLQLALLSLQRDLGQAVPRPIRDEFGDRQAAFRGQAQAEDGDYWLELTRAGWRNPAGLARSDLLRVGYRLEEGVLKRGVWSVLDRAQDTEPLETSVLEQVDAIEVRFLGVGDEWTEQWGAAAGEQAAGGLPRAVEVTLELARWGRIRRLFPVSTPPATEAEI